MADATYVTKVQRRAGGSDLAIAAGGNFIQEPTVMSADGAIAVTSGVVVITKSSAAALTLAAPASADDGKLLYIVSTTAQAHTVTNSSPGFNAGGAANDVATFGAAIGNNLVLLAYNQKWYVVSSVGITLA